MLDKDGSVSLFVSTIQLHQQTIIGRFHTCHVLMGILQGQVLHSALALHNVSYVFCTDLLDLGLKPIHIDTYFTSYYINYA